MGVDAVAFWAYKFLPERIRIDTTTREKQHLYKNLFI
jgi:hypothetical protein